MFPKKVFFPLFFASTICRFRDSCEKHSENGMFIVELLSPQKKVFHKKVETKKTLRLWTKNVSDFLKEFSLCAFN